MNVLNRRACWVASWLGLVACGGSDVSPGHTAEADAGKPDGSDGFTANDAGENTHDGSISGSNPLDAAAMDSSAPDIQPDSGADGGEPIVCVPGEARDILVVLDRSGSMKMANVDRWTPVSIGVNTIVAEAEDQTRFGLMLFPNSTDQCAAGEISVPIALHSAAAIALALTEEPGGGTPTAATLLAAQTALAAATRPTIIVLVTDGEPNCAPPPVIDPTGPIDPALFDTDQIARKDTEAAIKSLAAAGIKTYVLGVDATSMSLKKTLDAFALAGGTGETTHRPVLSAWDVETNIRSLLSPACP